MPVKETDCYNYEDINEILHRNADSKAQVYILFTTNSTKSSGGGDGGGAKSQEDTVCQEARDLVTDYIASFIAPTRDLLMIRCYLNAEQLGLDSPLTKDPRYRVSILPTLMHWSGPEILYRRECVNFPLVAMLFEDTPPVVEPEQNCFVMKVGRPPIKEPSKEIDESQPSVSDQ